MRGVVFRLATAALLVVSLLAAMLTVGSAQQTSGCVPADCKDHGKVKDTRDVGHGYTLSIYDDGTWELRDQNQDLMKADTVLMEHQTWIGYLLGKATRAYIDGGAVEV